MNTTALTDSTLFFLAASNRDLAESADPEWNRRFADLVRRHAIARANEAFGPMATALWDYKGTELDLAERFGKGWRENAEAGLLLEPLSAKVDAEEAFIELEHYAPFNVAVVALAMHPAPNLAAALFKLELIKREELHNFSPMTVDPWDVVKADIARLEGIPA